MKFQLEDGKFEALANDGRVIGFESRDEAVECAKLHCGIMKLLGHDCTLEDYIPTEKKATPAAMAVEKKIVRIRIDTDVEHIGMRKDTSSVSCAATFPSRGRIKEKALA